MGEEVIQKEPESGLEEIVESEKQDNEFYKLFVEDMKNIIADDSRLIFYLDSKNNIVGASKAALEAVDYETPRELNMRPSAWAKRGLNKWVDFNRANSTIKVLNLDKIVIQTYDKKELTVFNPKVTVYQNLTTVEIERAEKKEIKKVRPQTYTFKAPYYLDIAGSEKQIKESGKFIQEIMGCYASLREKDTLRIKMHRLGHLGEKVASILSSVLREPRCKIYKPNSNIYEILIANKFPEKNIEGYEKPVVKQDVKPEIKQEPFPETGTEGYNLGVLLK